MSDTPEAWDTAKIREAFIYDGGEADYYDPINGAKEQRRIAGDIFDRWLDAHDAEVRASVVAEEPEWEYGASPHIRPSRVDQISNEPRSVQLGKSRPYLTHGEWIPDTLVRRRKAGPWEPVE